jgi:hypothetical protein
MQPRYPRVDVPGDRHDGIMARDGHLIGISRTRAVWRFGYPSCSAAAIAFGADTRDGFKWALATHEGEVLAEYCGRPAQLPPRFRRVIEAPLA